MEDNSNKLSYFFLGLGLGVAVGILFAPKSGEETRDYLLNKADEGKGYLKRRGEEIRETATGAIHRSKDTVLRQKDQLAAAVEAGKQAYRDAVTNYRESNLGGEGV
ncbi:MAG: YtxH domain-containing protein [Bryobacter sp.]|jgi:gas vesicle protein|nr:YtxH domain-containing protein [Bryobacter sp.]